MLLVNSTLVSEFTAMKAIIDLSDIEDQLANCKPGDSYEITFTVDAKTDEELTGTATEVEHLMKEGDGYSDEDASEEPQPEMTRGPAGKKMPKAILMIAK